MPVKGVALDVAGSDTARMMLRSARSFVAGVVLSVLSGCSQPLPQPRENVLPASGTVMYQGQPVANAKLTFHGNSVAESAFAITDSCGVFQCMTNESGPGIVAGDYVITVDGSRVVIPERYRDADQSPLSVTVEEGGENVFSLELAD